jgi:hypothetical protein
MIVRRTIAFASLAFTLSTSLASAQTVERTDVTPMVGAINAERARFSLPPLGRDPRLDAVAEAHSLEMARARFFSHTSPSTGQPADRVSHAGLRWSAVAENIAINQSPEAAQQALLRSPGHHENMVDPVQRSIGVGIVRYGEQVWVTQLFAALNDTAGATPVTVAPAAIDDDDDEGDDEGDDVDEAPTAAPVPAPSAPVAAAPPTAAAAPMIPGFPMQGIPGLDQFLTGLGLTRQPTPAAPAARAGHTPAAPQVYTVQTPFGPVRVEVPSSFAAPSTPAAPPAAAPARPRSHRSHRPAPSRGRVIQIDTLDV